MKDKNAEFANWYQMGQMWLVVELGQPQHNSRIGVGDTAQEAWDRLECTPCQCTGRDGGLSAAIEWARGQGWIDSPLEEVDAPDIDEEESFRSEMWELDGN